MKTEIMEIHGRQFIHTWHEIYKIRKKGTQEIYDEAFDLLNCPHEYELTEIEKELPNEIQN